MKNITNYVVLVLIAVICGFVLGYKAQQVVIENECVKLGGFYFSNNVYQCVSIK
jgi:hypothetical protein